MENKPNHVQHVQNQIDYTNAVAETYNEQWKQWMSAELPKMVSQEVDNYLNSHKGQIQVDEQTLKVAKEKVSDLLKSIFK